MLYQWHDKEHSVYELLLPLCFLTLVNSHHNVHVSTHDYHGSIYKDLIISCTFWTKMTTIISHQVLGHCATGNHSACGKCSNYPRRTTSSCNQLDVNVRQSVPGGATKGTHQRRWGPGRHYAALDGAPELFAGKIWPEGGHFSSRWYKLLIKSSVNIIVVKESECWMQHKP